MNEETRNYIRQWISKANDDLIVIDKLTQNGIIAPSAICFHCQLNITLQDSQRFTFGLHV